MTTDKTTIRDATLHLSNDGSMLTINVPEDTGDGFSTAAYPVKVSDGQQNDLQSFFERHEG